MGGWEWQAGIHRKNFRFGYISVTFTHRKLTLGTDISWECRCATLLCDLDLTFDLAVVILTYKILSRLFLENLQAWEVYW